MGLLLFSNSALMAQNECDPEPPLGLSPLEAYSIFQSNYRGKDYQFALDYGRWIVCAKPETIEGYKGFNLSSQLDKFVRIYQALADEENDPSLKIAYLDSTVAVLDMKIELFADDGETVFDAYQKKGRLLLDNETYIDGGLQKAYAAFREMFETDPQKASEYADGYYLMVVIEDLVKNGDKADAQALISDASQYAPAGSSLADYLDKKQVDLLGSPEEQIEHFNCSMSGSGGLADDPDNLEILNTCLAAYTQLDQLSNRERISKKIHSLNPTFESASSLGDIEKSNANYTAAINFYEEALTLAAGDNDKVKIYSELTDVNLNLGKLPEAKKYTQEAIKINPNNGRSYIDMARIYAAAVTQCTENRKLEATDRVVYWLVIDYLNMAKSKDPSVTNTVNSQLSSYTPVTPSAEDRFLRLNMETGDKVKVDGSLAPCYSFINETTTVR